MNSAMRLGTLKIDPVAYGSQGSAILGIRDSGKTYSAGVLAEQLFDAGIPFIAFDPIGVWRFLRVPGKGKGYPIVVAGGKEGDLALTPASAPKIVEAAMQNGVSLVVDLFDINLSKADWRKIVMESVRLLLHRNSEYGLRHIFIEEASEFIPQKVTDGRLYAEMEKLARMGGNCRLGYTLINQRAEEVNKAVLELCDNLFLHRQKGKNSLLSLTKWLDVSDVADPREVIRSLPTLPQGECWAWMEGAAAAERLKVQEKQSFHPDRRAVRGAVKMATAGVDVRDFVSTLRETLVEVEEEAKANDPRALKAEIARLNGEIRQIASKSVEIREPDPKAVEKAERRGYERGHDEGYKEGRNVGGRQAAHNQMLRVIDAIAGAAMLNGDADILNEAHGRAKQIKIEEPSAPAPRPAPKTPAPSPHPRQPAPAVMRVPAAGNGTIGAERKPLTALAASWPGGLTEAQWATIAGLKRSGGTWSTYKSRLRTAGYIEQRGDLWHTTEAGIDAIGGQPPAPSSPEERIAMWGRAVGAARKLLDVLVDHYPAEMSREELAALTELSAGGGTFSTYLSRLSGNGLVEKDGDMLRASNALFE